MPALGSQGFDIGTVQLALVSASQRAQDKVTAYLHASTESIGVSIQTQMIDGTAHAIATVTQFAFDLTSPTNSALFNAAVNNLQLINNYATATMQALKSMISTNITNMR